MRTTSIDRSESRGLLFERVRACASFLFSGLLSDVSMRDHPLAWLDEEWSEKPKRCHVNNPPLLKRYQWRHRYPSVLLPVYSYNIVQCRACRMPFSVCRLIYLFARSLTFLRSSWLYASIFVQSVYRILKRFFFSSWLVIDFDAPVVNRRCSFASFGTTWSLCLFNLFSIFSLCCVDNSWRTKA